MTESINKIFTTMNLSLTTKIITLKIDYIEKKGYSPIMSYSFYFPEGTKIDLSLCENEKITIQVQLTNENTGNYQLGEKFQKHSN